MFHRPKTEAEQPSSTPAKQADAAPVARYVQQQNGAQNSAPQGSAQPAQPQGGLPQTNNTAPQGAPAQNAPVQNAAPQGPAFQGLRDKMFDPNKKDTTATEDKKMTDTEDNNNAGRPNEMPAQASAFQKPGIGPRVPGAYQGATFPGTGNSVYGASTGMGAPTAVVPGMAEQRKLVVGQGITMSGEIECCDTLLVEGTVEAALKGASVLFVAESGVFYGTVEIDEATIAGRFEGDLTVNGRLTVKSTGSITGSIVYKELAIEAGATLDGKVSPLGGSKIQTRGNKEKKNFSKGGSIANDGSELPFAGSGNA